MQTANRRFWRNAYFWILSAYVASRVAYFAAGIRFNVKPLSSFFQIADPLLLRTRLFETLLYLHTQPPGFNLMIGLVLKVFPSSYSPAFHFIYLACGVSLCFTLYRMMRIFEVRPWIAASLTILFLVSPGVVLFENLLIYEYPLMALLCVSAVLLHRLFQRPDALYAVLFFSCLAILLYIRALFHLGWFILIAAFVLWRLKGYRRMIVTAAAIPFLLSLAIFVKNAILIHSFTSSTWMEFAAETITTHQLTDQEHEHLIQAGVLSPMSRISAYDPLSSFAGKISLPPPSGIPVVDQLNDSTGRINYNNAGYLELYPFYVHEGVEIILHYPKAYVRSIVRAWFAYFLPTSDFPFFDENKAHIGKLDRLFNIVVFGQWRDASDRKNLRKMDAAGKTYELPLYVGTWLLLGLPLLFCMGVSIVWRKVRTAGWGQPATSLLTYLLFQIAFITVLVNFLSSFENNRYRLPVDPFFVTLLGIAIERGTAWRRSKSERGSIEGRTLQLR